jgi:hypothetical protein
LTVGISFLEHKYLVKTHTEAFRSRDKWGYFYFLFTYELRRMFGVEENIWTKEG